MSRWTWNAAVLAGGLLASGGQARDLVDVTTSMVSPPLPTFGFPPPWYAGATWGDVDGNGYDDAYVTNYFGANHLLLNVAGPPGGPPRILIDATPPFLADPAGSGEGAILADFDNDGDLDLYVVNAAGAPNHLFANLGAGLWADMTGPSGLAHPGTGEGCSIADIDGDGLLDIYLLNYGTGGVPEADVFYKNLGGLAFADMTAAVGLAFPPALGGACAFADYDLDGDADLFVGNDGSPNYLFENVGGAFVDVTAAAGGAALADAAGGCFGVRWIDADKDGDLDLYVSNSSAFAGTDPVSKVYLNDVVGGGTKTFAFVPASGAADPGDGMAVTGGDLDGDGDADLVVANFGATSIYFGTGGGLFTAAPASYFGEPFPDMSSSITRCDFDQDGDLDVAIGGSTFFLFENVPTPGGVSTTPASYEVLVRFVGDTAAPFEVPRDGHGTRAQARLRTPAGAPLARPAEQVDGGSGYAQDSPVLHWTVPAALPLAVGYRLDALDVLWSNGASETLFSLPQPSMLSTLVKLVVGYPAGVASYGVQSDPDPLSLWRASTTSSLPAPSIGASEFAIAARSIPAGSLAVLALGFAPAAIPLLGGDLLVVPAITSAAPVSPAGIAVWPLPIPPDAGAVGATLYFQAIAFPGVSGVLDWSNGLSLTVQP